MVTSWQDEGSGLAAGASDYHSITEGAVIASADSIEISGGAHEITGTTEINTITGGIATQLLYLRFSGACTFGSSGNIKASPATRTVDRCAVLRNIGGTWYETTDPLGINDARYVNVTGDTMTGSLNVGGGYPTHIRLSQNDAIADNKHWQLRSGTVVWGDFSIVPLTDALAVKSNPFYINPSGLVGIGTTTPSNGILEIAGDLNVNAGGSPGIVWIDGAGGSIKRDGTTGDLEIQAQTDLILNETSGNVGIGTSAPLAKLQVEATALGAIIGNDPTGSTGNIYFDDQNINASYGYIGNDGVLGLNYAGYQNGATKFRDLGVYNGKNSLIAFFQGSTGRLGIGTSAPDHTLHIVGSGHATSILSVGDNSASISGQMLNISNSTKSVKIEADPANAGAGSYLQFDVDGTERMRIDANGDVGIGTGSPVSRFEVEDTTDIIASITNTAAYSTSNLVSLDFRQNSSTTERTWFRIESKANNTTDASKVSATTFYANQSGAFVPVVEIVGQQFTHTANVNSLYPVSTENSSGNRTTGTYHDVSGDPHVYINNTSGTGKIHLDGSDGSIYERARTVAMGAYGGAWTPAWVASTGSLSAIANTTNEYSLVGKKMHVAVSSAMTLSGGPAANIQLTIPGGHTAASSSITTCMFNVAGTIETGYAQVNAAGTIIYFIRYNSATWPNGAHNVYPSFTFRIQ